MTGKRPGRHNPSPLPQGLGGVGFWSAGLRRHADVGAREAVREISSLEYRAVWIPGGAGGPVFDDASTLLAATPGIPVGIGVVNIWMHEPA